MKKFELSGKSYKANLHCHTTVSDGHYSPEEVKEYYKAHGYSVIAFTDHEILLDPVSYTHLDVYKRQQKHSCSGTAAFSADFLSCS